jgi:type IV secretory pathway VirB10-like protein
LSGPTGSKGQTKPAPQQGPVVMDPNQSRIAEYRQQLDEQSRKLQAEQAQMQQTKQQLAAASGGDAPNAHNPTVGSGQESQEKTAEESIREDRKRREYMSLFSSNVALSLRKDSPPSPATGSSQVKPATPDGAVASPSEAAPFGNLLPLLSALAQNRTEASPRSEQSPSKEAGSQEATAKPAQDPKSRFSGLNQADGKEYRLFEGTVFETVLTNRLTSSFNGPVNCMVTTNVYSHDRQHVLIPQGSRILGEAKRLSNFGEDRLAVVFHRVIMPDGYSLSLDQFKGLNQIGETGLRDQVNHHYMQIFGVSLAIGAIAGLAEANTGLGLVESSADAYRQGVASSLSQSSLRILDRYLNVLPTVTIREGHRVKVYLADDLMVPAYENHRMPGDL